MEQIDRSLSLEQEEERHIQATLEASGRLGTPLNLTSTPFKIATEAVAGAVMTGPRRYMVRRKRIEQGREELLTGLAVIWREMAERHVDQPDAFARAWSRWVEGLDLTVLNGLIAAHNLWYPAEANLPMDIRTLDYVTPDGRDYREEPVSSAWLLARYPADLQRALASRPASDD